MKVSALIAVCLLLFTAAYAAGDTITGRVSIATPPVITINVPVLDGWYSSIFTVNASINGTAHAVTYQWRNSSANGSYVNMTSVGNNIWTKSFNISSLADGNYTMLVNASNRFNMTGNKTVNFRIDNTLPIISSFVLTKTDTIYVGNTLTSADFSCTATDNSESIGGSLIVIITGLSTATAGTKTAICTATDSAGNIATASVVYTVVSAGGAGVGGAGGVAGNETQANETVILAKVPANATVKLTGFNAPIQYIEIETEQAISKSDINIKAILSAEPVPKAKVYIYLEIESNIPEDAMKSIRIAFSVDKSWLTENKLSGDGVALYRFVDGSWKMLGTNKIDETGTAFIYVAETPGFSTFAIAAGAPVLLNAVTGSAIAIPAVPLSLNMLVLILMASVMIVVIFLARRHMSRTKGKSVKKSKWWS